MPTPPPPARHAWSQRGTKGAGERKANNGLWVGGVQVVPAAWAGHAAGPFAPARDANGAGPSRTVPSLTSKGTAGVAAGRWEEASAAGGQTSVTAEPHRVAGRGSDGHSLPHPRIDKTNPSIKPSPQQNRAEKRAGVVRFGKGVGGHSTSRRTICSPGDKF